MKWVSTPQPGVMLATLRATKPMPMVTMTMAKIGWPTIGRTTRRSRKNPSTAVRPIARRAPTQKLKPARTISV